MLAFTDVDADIDVDADEDIDGVMLCGFLHRGLCRVNGSACNNGGKSRHPRYGRRPTPNDDYCRRRRPLLAVHRPPRLPLRCACAASRTAAFAAPYPS